jgi:hypothetical protein
MKAEWFSQNWYELVVAFGVLYGVLMSTYNFFDNRGRKKRIVEVKVSGGWRALQRGGLSEEMIFINLSNPGDRAVTVDLPYLKLPKGESLVTPIPLASVSFPFELCEGKKCSLLMTRADVIENLIKAGYKGKVPLIGVVRDLVGNEYESKKPYTLDIEAKKSHAS